jgi:hypothetical protein
MDIDYSKWEKLPQVSARARASSIYDTIRRHDCDKIRIALKVGVLHIEVEKLLEMTKEEITDLLRPLI